LLFLGGQKLIFTKTNIILSIRTNNQVMRTGGKKKTVGDRAHLGGGVEIF
jgi:hypothetical protein